MTEAALIGMGAMGSALARALLHSGHRVTVWNRTSAKAEPLARDGAVVAPSAAAAVSASPVVVVCVDNYEVTKTILGAKEVAPALAGRLLVQLSTGNPQEARDGEAWARERKADYLDGAILAYPSDIGTPAATILVSGAEPGFRKSEPLLRNLAGNLTYLGEQVGAASALDCATLSYLTAGIVGFLHGALICQSEGLRVDDFGSMLAEVTPVIGAELKHLGEVVQSGAYEQPQAALLAYAGAVERLVGQARDAGINAELPAFASGLFRRAMAAGHAKEEVAALIKVLRGSALREARLGGTE
jgi:3-hydroxyisobutyrate dehydrogenase-like beta-hydroxyacid dehydrogenase